jgi:hypothetical protein
MNNIHETFQKNGVTEAWGQLGSSAQNLGGQIISSSMSGLDNMSSPRNRQQRGGGGRGYYSSDFVNSPSSVISNSGGGKNTRGKTTNNNTTTTAMGMIHATSSMVDRYNSHEATYYQGRKIVPDIQHLYHVVDDKEAYMNYDHYMNNNNNSSNNSSMNSNRSSRNNSGYTTEDDMTETDHSGSRHSSLTRRRQQQRVVSLSEEELVDRMLSQFPEFGTNRPTPFTALDDDDILDNLSTATGVVGVSGGAGGITSPNSVTVVDNKDHNMGGGNNLNKVHHSNNNNNNAATAGGGGSGGDESQGVISPNSRFFTDETSDMIGKFFFGGLATSTSQSPVSSSRPAPPASAPAAPAPTTLKNTGSSSSLSTMTSTASGAPPHGHHYGHGGMMTYPTKNRRGIDGRLTPSGGVVIVGQKDGSANATATVVQQQQEEMGDMAVTNAAAHTPSSNNDYSSVWDQDEIDLWTNSSTIAPPPPLTPTTTIMSPANVESKTRVVDDSNDQRMMDRQKRRQNWDALVASNCSSPTNSLKADRVTNKLEGGSGGGSSGALVNEALFAPFGLMGDGGGDGAPSFLPMIHHDTTMAPPSRMESSLSQSQQQQPRQTHEEGGMSDNKVPSKPKGGAVVVDDGKDHWMPDKLCRACYSCEAPFTLIRRKHHCRVCGMIFCSSCSAYFVQISEAPPSSTKIKDNSNNNNKGACGMMRTCKMCYDHLSERGLGVIMRGVETESKVGEGSNNDEEMHSPVNATNDELPTMDVRASMTQMGGGAAHDILLQSDGPVTSSELSEQFAGFQGETSGGDFHALSITKQRLDNERRKREEQERLEAEKAEAEAAAAAAAEAVAAAALEGKTHRSPGGSFRQMKSRLSVRQMKWKSSSTNSLSEGGTSPETAAEEQNALDVIARGVTEAADQVEQSEHFKAVSAHGMGLAETTSGIEEALLRPNQSNDAKLSAKIHLGMVAADYLEKLGRELLQTDGPRLLKEIKESCSASKSDEMKLRDLWVDTLMTLATRCCATVEPDVKNGDLLDIRPYCKLKTIPGGSVLDSVYMSGVVFHKNVSHKRMARAIQNAKIMMLSGGIEYTRSENQIASLDTLLEQEERYMEIIVSKMFKLKPDVLIVGKSVCRKAQELLLRANIVLIQYVKPSLMSRIARQTGATVLSSIDHVMNSTILGK